GGDGVSAEGAGHLPWFGEIHQLLRPDHGRSRQTSRQALAASNQVRRDSVVLKREPPASAAQARLHFITGQENPIGACPDSQVLDVLGWMRRCRPTWNGFQDDARNAFSAHVAIRQILEKSPRLRTARERQLRVRSGIPAEAIHDGRCSARKLRTERPAVIGLFDGQNTYLL